MMLLDRLVRVLGMLTKALGNTLQIMRSLLNYLATAPLVHGMRSLSTVIETLVSAKGVVGMGGQADLLRRHITNFRQFPPLERMWQLVEEANAPFFSAHGPVDGKANINVSKS